MTPPGPATTLPLTAAQLTLWFDETFMDDCGLHTMGDCLELRGPVDLDRLLATLQLTANEVDALRTRYRLADNRPVQDIGGSVQVPVEVFEFRAGATPDERVAQAWDDMTARMDQRMDITRPPLMYAVVYPVAADHLLVLVAMHHIVADGYSRTTIYRRWQELYNDGPQAGVRLPPLARLLEAEAQYREGHGFAADERYWTRVAAALPDRVSLSTGGSEPGRRRLRQTMGLAPEHAERARTLLAERNLTWSVALTAMSLLYTAKFTGRDHVQVTFPVTARTTNEVRRTPGMMANYPPLAARVQPGDTVESFIRSVGRAVLGTIKHQRYRVQSIRNLAGFHQSDHVAFGPYVNVVPQEDALRFGETSARLWNVSTGAVDDLMFTFMDSADGGLDIHVNGNPELHSAAQVQAHAARLHDLIRRGLRELSLAVADLPLLADGDPAVAGEVGPFGRLDGPDVVAAVLRTATEDPARVAVLDDAGSLSYLELARHADAVARRLLPGAVAAVLAAPGRHFVTALVAALQAGAAWTPIDTESPLERQLMLVGDSGASVVLTTAEYLSEANDLAAAAGIDTVIQVDASLSPEPAGRAVDAVAVHPADPDSVAYVMFTSGTTGRPKGAMVHRAGLLNHLLAKVELLDLGPQDVVMQNAPVTFDVSVWQMLAPLLVGGTTRPVNRSTAANPAAIADLIRTAGLTHLELVPSFLRAALEYFDAVGARPLSALKTLMVTGEALPVDLCVAVHDRYPSLPLINAYGPTECSDDVTHAVLTAGRELGARAPIGLPIRNTRLMVLGPDLHPVPDGIVGELYVAGPCVGPGYLGDPVKTARTFTALPGLEPGQRAYRTGDHVVRNARGELEFVERRDHQIKINGQRIELGEVESGLRALTGVADAAATVAQSGPQLRLVAHVVLTQPADGGADGGTDAVVARLRAELASRTSAHLVPTVWSLLPALPLTSHGKVDRAALAAGEPGQPAVVAGPARDDTLRERSEQAPDGHEPDAGRASAVSIPLPPSPIQRQLADDTRSAPESARGYSQFVRLSTPPGLSCHDVDRLMARLTEVHPILALRLDVRPDGAGHLRQRSFGVNGWTSVAQGDPEADLAAAIDSLDIERGIVWRAVLDSDTSTLLLAIHHLAVDGVSWRILQSDLRQLSAGIAPPAERTRWRHWVVDQLVAAQHPLVADQVEQVWAGAQWQPTTGIAAPAGPSRWADSQLHTSRLDAAATQAFLAAAHDAGSLQINDLHINDLLLAALGLALAADPDLLAAPGPDARVDVEVEGHGREDLSALLADQRTHDLSRTVGWFTTNYPVSVRVPRGDAEDGPAVGALLAHVHDQTSAALAHGLTHGLARWLNAATADRAARRPVPSVGFNYLGRFPQAVADADPFAFLPATGDDEAIGTGATAGFGMRHPIEVTPVVWDSASGPRLVTAWRYDPAVLSADQVERLAQAWHRGLATVAAAARRPAAVADHGRPDATGLASSAGIDDGDRRERWRSHLFGVRWPGGSGRPTAAPARPDQLAVALDDSAAAGLADALRSGVPLRSVVLVAWAGALAEHAGIGEALVGTEFGEESCDGPGALLPLRVRLRAGERADQLVSRIDEEYTVLCGAPLSLAQVRAAVPGADWVLDSAVLLRPASQAGAAPAAAVHRAGAQPAAECALTLVVTAGDLGAVTATLHFDAARLTAAEATAHGDRFVEGLVALLDGRVPKGLFAGQERGARILSGGADSAPEPERGTTSGPVTPAAVAAAMARVLGRADVGPDDGFFALGGDSISVIALVSELRAAGHEVQVPDIYLHRTPRELAAASLASCPADPVAPPQDQPGGLLGLDHDELAALEAELGF